MSKALLEIGNYSLTFSFGDALKRLIGFLIIPIYTRYLLPTDYGKLALTKVALAIFGVFAMHGQGGSVRSSAFLKQEQRDLSTLISTSNS
jgi:O-antigen/teichoic acid export membrane protein